MSVRDAGGTDFAFVFAISAGAAVVLGLAGLLVKYLIGRRDQRVDEEEEEG